MINEIQPSNPKNSLQSFLKLAGSLMGFNGHFINKKLNDSQFLIPLIKSLMFSERLI